MNRKLSWIDFGRFFKFIERGEDFRDEIVELSNVRAKVLHCSMLTFNLALLKIIPHTQFCLITFISIAYNHMIKVGLHG
jgi:hypothetical protein